MLLEPENLRSYVDPATNAMLVSDLDPVSYLAWLKGRPVAGSKLLANFLHEWTHRWCFDSQVGAALALLRLRAGCRTLRGKSAFDDYVRCMTGSVMLEPLAEGLALFAEFDAYPGKSSWMSQTLAAAGTFFMPAVETERHVITVLEGLLQSLRRDPALLERKAGIYCLAASNPYSLGYLSVKGLWYQMRTKCAALSDLDLFLSYLRSYIYDDPGIVIAILGPARDELRAAEKIANRVMDRFRELLAETDLDERVALWIKSAHTGSVAPEAINASEQDTDKSDTLLHEALVEDAGDSDGLNLAAWTIMTLEERMLCVLGTTPVQVEPSRIKGQGNVHLKPGEEPLYTVESTAHGRGDLLLVASRDGAAMMVLLQLLADVILVSSFGEYTEEELELAKRHVVNRARSENVYQEIRTHLEKEDGVAATVWNIIASRVSKALDAAYGPLCTTTASDADWRTTFGLLKQKGVFGLLGDDAELARALASIGLVNSFSHDCRMMRVVGRVLGIEEDALERALKLDVKNGLRLVVRKGESAMALV